MFFKCECSFLTELDIESNSFKKKYIKVCTKHAKNVFTNKSIKEQYIYSKKKNFYVLRNKSESSSVKIRSIDSCDSTDTESILSFGKYSGENFSNVLRRDKPYCKNIINITSRKQSMPAEMHKFSEFLKKQI